MSLPTILEEWLYPVKISSNHLSNDPTKSIQSNTPLQPLPPNPRQKSMKVLALGLSRSGTDSLRRALAILGYEGIYHGLEVANASPSVHKAWTMLGRRKWGPGQDARPVGLEDFEPLLGHCDAVTDQPCACFALELVEAYPDAKVILNYREVDSWHESITNTFGVYFQSLGYRVLPFFTSHLYWLKQVFVMYNQSYYQGSMVRNGKRIHEEHYAMIRGALKGQEERYLEWRVQDGWEPLCEFLGKGVPREEFPRGNGVVELQGRARRARERGVRKAWGNLGLVVGLVAVLGVGWMAMLYR